MKTPRPVPPALARPARRHWLAALTCAAWTGPTFAAEFVLERGGAAPAAHSPAARQTLRNFAQAYGQAGRPRVALWWNRQLSDRHSDQGRDVARLDAEVSADGRRASLASSRGREAQVDAARRSSLSERDLFQVETAFTRGLLDAGVRVVDRATIVRLAAVHKGGSQAPAALDAQQLEMQALAGHADVFLEVLLSPDVDAPLGVGFRIDLKQVRSGQVLGTAYLHAMPELPPPAPAHFEARPGGYVRVSPPPPTVTVEAVGDALVLQTLAELQPRLAGWSGR